MKKSSIIFNLFLFCAAHLYAQPRNQVFVGARPLGLGETFVSIADDGNAVYWNPAGLPTLKRFEFNSMYANWFGIQGLRNAYVSFVYPISPRFVLGSSYIHFGLDGDKELEFFRDQAYASLGARVVNNLMLGANVKYLNTDARLDGTSFGKANGLGFDLGALYVLPLKRTKFLKQINFGVMAHDVGGTGVVYTGTEKSEKVLSQNIRFGFSLFPKDQLSLKWFSIRDALLSFDFDDRFHAGAEAWPLEHLGVRLGLQKDLHTEEPSTFSFGSSLKFPALSIQMDYAYVIPPTLSSMHVFSFSFVPSVSPVKITDLSVNDLFSSFYKSYATSKIGYVTVRNDYDQELKMTLKVSIPGLTESATHETFVLGPNEQRTSSFPAILSKNAMDVREPEFRQAKVRIEYKIKNEDKLVEASKKFRLFGRGAMTWEDPGKAAAFITKLDRMVELFSREVTKDLPYRPEIELGHLYAAAALFDAMGGLGIKYRQDPENPFSVIPKTQHSVDYVKYPAELLLDKQGDCDDLTMLYASLLEYSGIRTALLSMSGHITLMFDTGIHERNWGVLPLGDSLVVKKDKSLWIPVEVTAVGKSFAQAWQAGGKKYREAQHDEDFEVINVREVEGVYLSALPEELQNRIPELPPAESFAQAVANDLAWIEDQRTHATIAKYWAALESGAASDSVRNRLGIIFALQDSLARAEEQFNNILLRAPENAAALVNGANLKCLSGNFLEAEQSYLKAAAQMANEPGLYLNLAILYQLWKVNEPGDSTRCQIESEKNLLRAFELLRGDEAVALDLLGIAREEFDFGEKADVTTWFKQQATAAKKFIKDSAKKYLFNKSVAGARVERKAVKRGVDTDRGYILWWAEGV